MSQNRRNWIKQTAMMLGGLSLLPKATECYPMLEQPPHQEGAIVLAYNENPYGPSPATQKAMQAAIASGNRYAWDTATALRKAIASNFALAADQVLLAAGSTEILSLVAQMAASKKGNVVTAHPSFGTCTRMAQRFGLTIKPVPLDAAKKIQMQAMLAAIGADTQLLYVCNPNNPTGTMVDSASLRSFIAEASQKCMVLLDEAYLEYTDEKSLADLTADNNNLIIAKTFSKIYGMAGTRVGYAIASTSTIEKLKNFQAWQNGNVGVASLTGAMAALQDASFTKMVKEKNILVKKLLYNFFEKQDIAYIPSHTSFVYYSVRNFKVNLEDTMKKQNIIVNGIVEEDGKWSRITMGTQEEMEKFIAVCKQANG
jgi:histidinol-phosphate aminotransferase